MGLPKARIRDTATAGSNCARNRLSSGNTKMQVDKNRKFHLQQSSVCSEYHRIGLTFASSAVYRRDCCSLRRVLSDVKGDLSNQETETHASWLTTGSTQPFRPGLPREKRLR